MSEDPATERPAVDRVRRVVVSAGHGLDAGDDPPSARTFLADGDPKVRAAALATLWRLGQLGGRDVVAALADTSAAVKRRACEIATAMSLGRERVAVLAGVRRLLRDSDPLVVEAACWAVGERRDRRALPPLSLAATSHPDPRCREAAVAALGAIGDPRGLASVLASLEDRPAVRRRAAVALAAFTGPEPQEALRRCLGDRDWQVRQVAEELLEIS